MDIPEDFRFKAYGLSAKRMAYGLSVLSLFLVPVDFYVPCEVSAEVCGLGIMLALSAGVLALFIPRGTSARFRPVSLALAVIVAHLLSFH
jgi:hypothetical protein